MAILHITRPGPRTQIVNVVAAIVGIIATVAVGAGLYQLSSMEDAVDDLGGHGASLEGLRLVQRTSMDVQLFAARERFRLATGSGAVPDGDLVNLDAMLRMALISAPYLVELGGDEGAAELLGSTAALQQAVLTYINSKSPADLDNLLAVSQKVRTRADELAIAEGAGVESRFNEFRAVLDSTRVGLLGGAVIVLVLPVLLILWMGRKYAHSLDVAVTRERSLTEANQAMERRDSQFRALYQVVSEVNETLSLRYIGRTAVREARKLVEADVTVLRVLEGKVLRVVDMEGGTGSSEHDTAHDIELGEGLVGRAAKRGKTALITSGDNDVLGSTAAPDARSGLIVPLIVGARVVGTLACWSREPNRFTNDDLHMLELMGAQVATAIAAADTHEASDRDAHRDALTGLANRRQLVQDAKYEYDAAVKRGRRVSVAMVDIDHFKRFNDTYGHQGGDIALQHVATVLAEQLRPEDRIYRYGGEEFAVVFDALTTEQSLQACERLRQAVERQTVPASEGVVTSVTISLGLASSPDAAQEFGALLTAADEALYASKEAGRNRLSTAGTPVERTALAA